jgi:hypothetical protein
MGCGAAHRVILLYELYEVDQRLATPENAEIGQVAPSTFLGDTEYTLTRPFIRRLPCPAMSFIAKIARSRLS